MNFSGADLAAMADKFARGEFVSQRKAIREAITDPAHPYHSFVYRLFTDLDKDVALLEWARELAPRMLSQYPHLAQAHIQRWLGAKSEFLKA